jgi:arsenite methyltransferase
VLELLAIRPGERVVDLGCGPGTLTLRLSAATGTGGQVVAVDLAEGMLRLLRREAPGNVRLARADGRLVASLPAGSRARCGPSP